jgi:hypothetical protein
MAGERDKPMTAEDDAVARNRAANPRRTPDRTPLGDHLMPKLYASTAAALLLATIVLIVVLAR